MAATGPDYSKAPRGAAATPTSAPPGPVSSWVRPLVDAATAFSDAYVEHLNHHCAKCTKAWDALKAALEAVPPK